MTPRRNPGLLRSGLLSLGLGVLLAIAVLTAIFLGNAVLNQGNYCSETGIGRFGAQQATKMVVYIDRGWSGVPPVQHCRVYLVETTNANPPLSAEQALRHDPKPHRLLAAGTAPETGEYAWALGVLLLPPAIWGLLTVAGVSRHRGRR